MEVAYIVQIIVMNCLILPKLILILHPYLHHLHQCCVVLQLIVFHDSCQFQNDGNRRAAGCGDGWRERVKDD